MKITKILGTGALLLACNSYPAFSVTPDFQQYEKDNTALNRDLSVTAETQLKGSDADVELTRRLREKLMADNLLSTSAQNIKIITVGEQITLTGPVANKAEKLKIEKLARSMAGKKKIRNQLNY